jgi:outer membrane protein assembly factor BamD
VVGAGVGAPADPAAAIPEYNKVLTSYFRHAVAASAQYRVARCLDAMGRRDDALGSYEAVLRGYSLSPEAPAAAYLAGLGHLRRNRPLAAAPYFQLVLDRYASHSDARGLVAFASPEHQELVEAALCMLEYAYHRAGDLGQLSGAPHVLLQRMPPSRSTWRAWAMLIDADASAAQGRHPEAQASLERLMRDFPDHPVGASATQLLAWTYSKQGRDSLAIATEERLLARWGAGGNQALVGGAMLDIAHERFNQKRYKEAAGAYEDFLRRHPGHPKRLLALYQAGLCYLRLDRAGDAVDRWETLVRDSATAPIAERAWARAGDLYFQADRFADAIRCYQGLLEHFSGSGAASLARLRLGQCEYNAGHDALALEHFSATIELHPGTPAAREAHRGTELALYRLSQTRDGERELARLIEQFPGSAFAADAQFRLAQRAYSEKRWPEAAEAFRQVVSRFPSYSGADQAQFLMAEALAQAKRPDESRQALEQFVAYFPESELRATVRFRLGLLRFDAKDHAAAAVDFTLALQDSAPAEVASAARYNLALCQRMLGQPDEAAAELARYRAAWPADQRAAEVAYQLGDLHETAGRMAEAAAEFDRALASRPSGRLGVELRFRLGRLREQAGDRDAALREYRAAAAAPDRDDPFRLSAVARCAALYEARREFTRALEAYRDLVRNSSDRELVAAAADRVSQLEASVRSR